MYKKQIYTVKSFECLESTQSEIMLKKWDKYEDFLFLETESQTKGLTRKKNTLWHSKKGDILFSLRFKSKLLSSQIMFLNFIIAQQIIKVIVSSPGAILKIKWPNDVYLGKEKVAGILTNVSSLLNTDEKIVYIGVGINTSQDRSKSSRVKINSKWLLFEKIVEKIKRFEDNPSLYTKKIQKSFTKYDYFKDMHLIHKNKKHKSIGIDRSGFLLIGTRGEIITIYDTKEIQYIKK